MSDLQGKSSTNIELLADTRKTLDDTRWQGVDRDPEHQQDGWSRRFFHYHCVVVDHLQRQIDLAKSICP